MSLSKAEVKNIDPGSQRTKYLCPKKSRPAECLPYVSESLVIEKDGKLIALVYPDYEVVKKEKISPEQLKTKMDENRKLLNHMLPMYSQDLPV